MRVSCSSCRRKQISFMRSRSSASMPKEVSNPCAKLAHTAGVNYWASDLRSDLQDAQVETKGCKVCNDPSAGR